jgi:hypothetical protein
MGHPPADRLGVAVLHFGSHSVQEGNGLPICSFGGFMARERRSGRRRALRASSGPVTNSILRHLLFFLDGALSATQVSRKNFRSFTKMRLV